MMMRVGALILLFVAFQLWGTGLATSQAQNRLTDEFDGQLAAIAAPPTTIPDEPESLVTAPADLPIPEAGDPVARIEIPRIGVDFIVLQGVDLRLLQDGPGHFPQTPLPGQAGNASIAGHRTTYKAPFNRIDELDPGDEITITSLQGTFTYRVDTWPNLNGDGVFGHFIVESSDIGILDQTFGNRLTLMACHPKFSAAQRIVVTATMVSNPAPTTSQGDLGDLVTTDASVDALAGGDSGAWPGALLFSALAGAIWFGTWFAARSWKRLPAYLIGTPLVLVALFFAFQNIARLLPASY
jgi:sortase A